MFGQGNISFQQLRAGASGPPFPANAADNGLSVDPITGHIVLGNDVAFGPGLAAFLSNREIEQQDFSFSFKNTSGGLQTHTLQLDPANGLYSIGDFDFLYNGTLIAIDDLLETINLSTQGGTNSHLFLDHLNQLYELGDIVGNENNTKISVQDLISTVLIDANLSQGLKLDMANNKFTLGNPFSADGTHLDIEQALSFTQFRDFTGIMLSLDRAGGTYAFGDADQAVNGNLLNIDDASNLIRLRNTNVIGLDLDFASMIFQFGDTSGIGNGTSLTIDDGQSLATIQDSIGSFLTLDRANQRYSIGDVIGADNGLILSLNDGTSNANIGSNAGQMLDLDQVSNLYRIGDLDAALNGGLISVDDGNGNVIIDNTLSNMGIVINGVPGFTGTVAAPATITVNNGIVTNVA